MRAISVKQPWASLLLSRVKRTENRGRANPWTSAVGERLALHASLTADTEVPFDLLQPHYPCADVRGALLGTFTLAGVHHPGSGKCRCDPDFAQPDQWHLVCIDMQPLAEPIPAKGALGLWSIPQELVLA
jgi:hypothetical protein